MLTVRGEIESLMGREIYVEARVGALNANKQKIYSNLTPGGGVTLGPYEVAYFEANLTGGQPGTSGVEILTVNDLGGTIAFGDDKAKRAELRKCMFFRALLPSAGESGSESVEVRLRNTCEKPIPADRTTFKLILRHGTTIKDQRIERFREEVPPGGEIRRSVMITVPPFVHPEAIPFDEVLDR